MQTAFTLLSKGWNAEPDAPYPVVRAEEDSVIVTFYLNPFQYDFFKAGDWAEIVFPQCSRYRLGPTNDEGWYRGQCRFSDLAPNWGEFYRVTGDPLPKGKDLLWKEVATDLRAADSNHFLFYFRDQTFECDASDWLISFHAAPRRDRSS
jgi:hypothetical protein